MAAAGLQWIFGPGWDGPRGLVPRWIFLRGLALVYLSAFGSLLVQIRGLIGPEGILPATHTLRAVMEMAGAGQRFWYAPTVFWVSAGNGALLAAMVVGGLAALAALVNLWPRVSFLVCFVCFLSFVAAASEFSGYQSDGMLLEAGFLALFFAPEGLRPGLGAAAPASRASLWLLRWEWFRIYFESGLVKWLSGDPQWRHLTAMDEYYQNSPLPTWIGWYVAHLPHWFQVASAAGTLGMEFLVVWMVFLPARLRFACFLMVTPWEIGVILTGNYAFLNYLVLLLGVLLLDDRTVGWLLPTRWRGWIVAEESTGPGEAVAGRGGSEAGARRDLKAMATAGCAVLLTWVGYATVAELVSLRAGRMVLPGAPVAALEPFRIANQYGLFAVMTRGRYEVEFQGSDDGTTWTAYPFRWKPQAVDEAPGIYAPFQPRFDWNLWFASLGDWRQNQIVPLTEERLLENDAEVLRLFRGDPFTGAPPRYVRAVLWQYWFTSLGGKQRTGNWWRRRLLGRYGPTIRRTPEGEFVEVAPADELPEHD